VVNLNAPITTGANTDFYMSYFRYNDANAHASGPDLYFGEVDPTDGTNTAQTVMDTQNYTWAPFQYLLAATTIQLFLNGCNNVSGPACPANGGLTGPQWTLPLAAWQQVEWWYHTNSCTGGVTNSDGFSYLYLDGTLVDSHAGVDMQGCQLQLAGSQVNVGGWWGFDAYELNGACVDDAADLDNPASTIVVCSPFSACPTTTTAGNPCIGQQTPFNVYLDDVILLVK
jgi:hypothetical protein